MESFEQRSRYNLIYIIRVVDNLIYILRKSLWLLRGEKNVRWNDSKNRSSETRREAVTVVQVGAMVLAWWKRCDPARSGGRRVPVKAGRGG